MADRKEKNVLVLQGGGALGAYQSGAYTQLSEDGYEPDWVAGISIGAINAALICGNPKKDRAAKLSAFWEEVSSGVVAEPFMRGLLSEHAYAEVAAASVMATGVPGFFRPRTPSVFWPFHLPHPLSVYDTTPLHDTLLELVDFDYLNDKGPRLSVGAVDVEAGNFAYFDTKKQKVGPEHIMASGALPPGFAPVEIEGRQYWDGGLVSNTPLQFVMENTHDEAITVFQIDLFSARGAVPEDLTGVAQREKDIRYSSRTRLTTDRYRQLHQISQAAEALRLKLPAELRDDPDLAFLRHVGAAHRVSLVHLIHRKESFEGGSKDYEFSHRAMVAHWAAGQEDVKRTLAHPDWTGRNRNHDGLAVYDLSDAVLETSAIGD